MKILIEGEKYNIDDLKNIFDDPKFYTQKGLEGYINSVGYYHSFGSKHLVYMLPKVFMKDAEQTIFGISKIELLNYESDETYTHAEEFKWARQLLIYFYNSLKEYKRRYSDNIIVETNHSLELNTNVGETEYTYLDLLLSFVNFYKKNKVVILFKHIEFKSNQTPKPTWEKTIRKSLPILNDSQIPIYLEINNKKKVVNNEEELIIYFFSILNYFNQEHQLLLKIDKSYDLIKGNAFINLQKSGLSKLRKIKHRYFSDTLKRMYRLCEIYFKQTDESSVKRKKEEFISVKNYNLVFEDMIDKLFSDRLDTESKNDNLSLNDLKYNNDGKIIDHIYKDKSLIDTSNIFYIGDSKYYKSNSEAGKISKYKQITYAKNVIQFNIDLLNKNEDYENIRYRDSITEGYNITPNFFIYGYIADTSNFDNSNIKSTQKLPVKSYHFEHRLFDRDTLFVHQYEINFLYVLKSYSTSNLKVLNEFRDTTKKKFRDNFLTFLNNPSESKYIIYEKEMLPNEAKLFVDGNFKLLNGKCLYTNDGKLLISQHTNDETINDLRMDFIRKQFL